MPRTLSVNGTAPAFNHQRRIWPWWAAACTMAARRRERDHPFWMSYEVQKKVQRDLFMVQQLQRRRVTCLRETNRMLHYNSTDWKTLTEIRNINERIKQQEAAREEDIMNSSVVDLWVKELQEKRQTLETEFMEHCRERYEGSERFAYLPGPVGELPVHNCLLLGLTDLAKRLINELHSPSAQSFDPHAIHDVNMPYTSDLAAWRDLQFLPAAHPYDDRGLFTGKTLLHIAVVQKDTQTVRWLIEEKGASIAAQAVGAFFKSQTLSLPKKESSMIFAGRKVSIERSRDRRRAFDNPYGQCDYGEYPLSFAASMGQVKVMVVMKDAITQLIRKDESGTYYDHLVTHYPSKMRVRPSKWSKEFHVCFLMLNAQDSDGNTALHKAVEFGHLKAIDWLLANGGYPSLRTLNDMGYSPVTLAAKCGHVEVFNHLMESEHITEISWCYGPVARTLMNLEQLDTYVVPQPVGAAKEAAEHERYHLLNPPLDTSHPDWRSAIQVIVDDEKQEFAHDAFFMDIIMQKWNKFARWMFVTRKLIPHYVFTILFIITLSFRANEVRTRWEQAYLDGCLPAGASREAGVVMLGETLPQYEPGVPLKCITDTYESTKDINFWVSDLGGNLRSRPWEGAILILQLCVQTGFCIFTAWTGWRWRRLKKRDLWVPGKGWYENFRIVLFKNLTFLFDYCTVVFLIVATLFRLLGDEDQELQMLANASIFVVIQCVLLLMAFRRIGVFIITMFVMLFDDMLKFVVIYITVCLGFAFALTAVIDYPDVLPSGLAREGYFWHHFWGNFYEVVLSSLTKLEAKWQPTPYLLVAILNFIFALLACILLLNFLIAMMARTFEENVGNTHVTWIFPFAYNVLRYEKMLPKALRAEPTYRIGEPKEGGGHEGTSFVNQMFYIIEVKERKNADAPAQAGDEAEDVPGTDDGHEKLERMFEGSLKKIDEFCTETTDKLRDLLASEFGHNPKAA